MKLATYNIWNSSAGMPLRFTQIVNEIVNLDADIICLQEVTDIPIYNALVLKKAVNCHMHWWSELPKTIKILR